MNRELYDKILRTLYVKGIPYTVKKVTDIIDYYIRTFFHEYFDYLLSVIVGSDRAFRIRVAVFKYMCNNNLFWKRQKALWLGRSIRHNALKVTYIDPRLVKYRVRRGSGPSPYIQDGDWDLSKTQFKMNKTVIQLFIDKVLASETEEYKVLKTAMGNKDWKSSRGCRTLEDLDNYFKTLEDIYRDMTNGTFRPSSTVNARYQNVTKRYYPDEICVSIGRNKEYIIERGGSHRLSIAQLVNIERIPVIIIGKHYQYIESKENWTSMNP
ncbi:MAG: hypothetical protein H8D45_06035 [Bacteroidetes bacterium]|nr:hypothetical protein [Bacteroidota bacterium]